MMIPQNMERQVELIMSILAGMTTEQRDNLFHELTEYYCLFCGSEVEEGLRCPLCDLNWEQRMKRKDFFPDGANGGVWAWVDQNWKPVWWDVYHHTLNTFNISYKS